MKRSSTTIAIASGKGGVGKSVVSVNLAETLARHGHSVALLDADWGQGACAVLLNEQPSATLADVCRRTAAPQAARLTTEAGITLVSCAGEPGAAEGYEQALYQAMDEELEALRRTHRFILIDTPAGTEGPVRWALDRADLGALVVAGEPTSVADAYRLARYLFQRDPDYPLGLVVNFEDEYEEAVSVAERFGKITDRFTGVRPKMLGWVPYSRQIRQSVRRQDPAVRDPGPARDAFDELAELLLTGRAHRPSHTEEPVTL